MTAMTATTGLTVSTEHAWLNHALRDVTHTPASSVYVMCLTAAPDDSGTYTEVSGGSYARQAIAVTAATARATETSVDVTFTAVPAGTVTWLGLIDTASGAGRLIAAGPVDTPVDPAGDDLVIPAGGLKIIVAAGPMTDYLAHEMLDHEFRSESYAPTPTVESALIDDLGVEFSGGTYSRQTVTFGAAAGSQVANSVAYEHTGLAAGTWAASHICEDTAGPALYVLTPSAPKALAAGSALTFAVGSTVCGLS